MKMISGLQKRKNNIWQILERMFLLFMAVQIVTGFVWFVKNIGYQSLFHETKGYLKAAQTLQIDEYMGILYPVLIRLAKEIVKGIPVPYYVVLYLIQVGTALIANRFFLKRRGWIKETGKKGKLLVWFLSLYFVTFPMLLQVHTAVLPYSLAVSVSSLLISEGLYYMKNTREVCGSVLIKLCGLWLVTYLLVPEYSWFMGIYMCGVLLRIMLTDKKWTGRIIMALLSTVLCFGVIGTSVQTPGSMGRMQKTVGTVMVHRFLWPNFVRDSFFWDERISDTFSYYDLLEFAQSPEAVEYKFGPALEEKYGKEEAEALYRQMAAISFDMGSKQILINMGKDFLANACPQAGMQMYLADNETSVIAWNYGRLQDHGPLIAKYYLQWSLSGWNFMCLVAAAVLLIKKIFRQKDAELSEKNSHFSVLVLLLTLLGMALWYTMSRGMQDYKYVMMNSFFWLFPIIKGFIIIRERGSRYGF